MRAPTRPWFLVLRERLDASNEDGSVSRAAPIWFSSYRVSLRLRSLVRF